MRTGIESFNSGLSSGNFIFTRLIIVVFAMKIICIGRNYTEHAKELNNEVPAEPVIFMKAKNALLGPDKPLYYPEFTDDLHYECELVVKIAKNGKFIQEKFAKKYYNEVSLGIDFTARDMQKKLKDKGLPWELAKAFDGSAAVGKFISTDNLNLADIKFQLKLNDKVVQDGHTKDMIFTVDQIIEYVSKFFTLNIGDLIYTGTPAGVGPLNVYDKMEGYLEGQKLLEVEIK
jgi:acylpyruvate hydrolase